jgi:NAD(P)-dependent dehydrogenase (short-subunit alcohol dehydrogenase family)
MSLPRTPSFSLQGRRALVAGAGRGIGAAAAAALCEAGAEVTLAARSATDLQQVATKAMAWELGPHRIRVNTLCPTFIETEMTRPMLADPAFRDFVQSKIALGRIGQLQDVMGAVLFLANDASALVTGSALMVDGGWTAA